MTTFFSSDDLLISTDEDMDSNVTLAWKQVWKTDSYDNLFQGLLEPQISCQENKIRGYIDPDTIHCPLLLQDSSLDKVHHAKTFWSRTPSVLTDIDFDYGTEIGRAPEEWPNISGDTDSVFETTAISLENFLLSSTMFSEAEAILKRRAKLIDVRLLAKSQAMIFDKYFRIIFSNQRPTRVAIPLGV